MRPALKVLLLITALLALPRAANAITPDALLDWCSERKLADKYPEDASADYHTEAVLGYLTAVLDSLHEENPACRYRISGREFCGSFKSFMKTQGSPGGSAFNHARAAIVKNFDCSKNEAPASGTKAR